MHDSNRGRRDIIACVLALIILTAVIWWVGR